MVVRIGVLATKGTILGEVVASKELRRRLHQLPVLLLKLAVLDYQLAMG